MARILSLAALLTLLALALGGCSVSSTDSGKWPVSVGVSNPDEPPTPVRDERESEFYIVSLFVQPESTDLVDVQEAGGRIWELRCTGFNPDHNLGRGTLKVYPNGYELTAGESVYQCSGA